MQAPTDVEVAEAAADAARVARELAQVQEAAARAAADAARRAEEAERIARERSEARQQRAEKRARREEHVPRLRVQVETPHGTKRRTSNPLVRRERMLANLRASYGLTEEQYDALVLESEGRCGACNRPTPRLVVDHCHATGLVRGLLCGNCNIALGHVKDDVARLSQLIRYLECRDA